ncbi:Rho GTPase activation protein [Amylocystis lapponica]|nr:Rho GTPase activation protein [Amylocystis lapponica]
MSTREFYVSVELYISAKVAATLRKPAAPPKRSTDKRDATRLVVNTHDQSQKKVREKSSWLSLGRNTTGTEQWRPAICKLVEEDEACLLNIYIDETILYKSVYVYLLNHTDIRPVHRSLFDRKDILGIFCVAGQAWSATPNTDPLFLQFADTDAMNIWLTLLRSYAMPEVYGRWLSPEDGGLYRMWRQVELTCLQGRNLGTRALPEDGASGDPADPDAIDLDVYCELSVNGCLCGRTTVKKGVGSPDWQERFTFADLPPFENLKIVVWREKRMVKPVAIGSVLIVLVNFRRSEYVEGWFPVLHGGPTSSVQVGEMRLRVRVDEEIILPYHAYSPMLKTFSSRNSLDWMSDLESKLKLKTTSSHIISIAIAKNMLMENIMELADREVDGTLTCTYWSALSTLIPVADKGLAHNTLFRGNTVLTKTMELFMAWYGTAFLEASVGSTIRRLCGEKIAIEVDPVRSSKGSKGVEKGVELLVYWCQEFWTGIYEARTECPPEMRRLFQHIRNLVEDRYHVHDDHNKDLPWQSVSAFCFLRFIVPAILHPHLFGLWPGLPDARVQRSLTLIAKVIQNLANLNATVQKEEFMRGVKDFLTSSLPAMIEYIVVVSTPDTDTNSSSKPSGLDRHERLRIMNALRQRGSAAPVLHREATPLLPHLLDIPKHLAVITSVVVRYSRTHSYVPSTTVATSEDEYFDEFCAKCLDVEEEALHRVSQLASRPRRSSGAQHGIQFSPLAADPPLPSSLSSPPNKMSRNGHKSSSSKSPRHKHKSVRPSTAPPASSPDSSRAGSISPTPDTGNQFTRSRASLSQLRPMLKKSSFPERLRDGTRAIPHPPSAFVQHPRSSSTDSSLTGSAVPDKGCPIRLRIHRRMR